jgi:succinyl-CoA synthetase beta subunit
LNPKGRIWTMVAGGGASVIYADTVGAFIAICYSLPALYWLEQGLYFLILLVD